MLEGRRWGAIELALVGIGYAISLGLVFNSSILVSKRQGIWWLGPMLRRPNR
jgi:hypothetical protein